jgi:hypothetical protein
MIKNLRKQIMKKNITILFFLIALEATFVYLLIKKIIFVSSKMFATKRFEEQHESQPDKGL